MDLCFNFVKKIGFCELLFLIELNVELMFVLIQGYLTERNLDVLQILRVIFILITLLQKIQL